jgi:hypothetical protein
MVTFCYDKTMRRLIWNFEIDSSEPLQWQSLRPCVPDGLRWEARFFWPEESLVTLKGLDESFLELSRYQIKHREDTYCLLPNDDYNIKIRRGQLLYKPLLERSNHAVAYGKKINLEEQEPHTQLPGANGLTAAALRSLIETTGIHIRVEKEALIYKIATTPTIKLEFAALSVAHQRYFSLSIETRVADWIPEIRKHLLGHAISSDYITFLRSLP